MWILHTKYKISKFLYFKTVQTDFFVVLLYGRKALQKIYMYMYG